MTASALVNKLRARGVELITDGSRLGVRPAGVLTEEEREELRQHKAEVLVLLAAPPLTGASVADLIAQYQHILSRLWFLNIPPDSGAVDAADARTLLAELARLCDELGPAIASAVSRQHARTWARTMGRCPWCGLAGVFHDPDSGQEIAL